MKISLISAVRNAENYLARYFGQVAELNCAVTDQGDALSLVIGEGDSTDGTRHSLGRLLHHSGLKGELVDVTHGGPVYGSVEDTRRFAQLAGVYNALLPHIPADADVALFVEADLIWEPETLLALIAQAQTQPAVYAPMIMDGPQSFYDVWAYRRDGLRFTKRPPYHHDLNGALLEMDSVGSCLAMPAAWARGIQFPQEDVVVGFCRQLREQGHSIRLDPRLAVRHN